MTDTRNSVRLGNSPAELKKSILNKLYYIQGRLPELATPTDWYMALAYAVRDRMMNDWIRFVQLVRDTNTKIVAYLSAEFLLGRHLENNLINLGIRKPVQQAVADLGLDFDEILQEEAEPGLGSGGLGRLAACYMDSLATLQVPAIGYGISYEFGLFEQEIRDGWQVEKTDKWLRLGNPWEICRPEISYSVYGGGHTEQYQDGEGRFRVRWIPHHVVKGVACDTPIAGYRAGMSDFLRLWKSEAIESFDLTAFNVGNYYEAVEQKIVSEIVSKVLYPNDEPEIGKRLRLWQQYFFVSCSLQDMMRINSMRGKSPATFHESFAVQLNDTHPSIAVPELMRLLVDEYLLDWDRAWDITRKTFSYTNHTLLPEALEKWPLSMFAAILPRHLDIIYEINRRFLDEVRLAYPDDQARLARLSLIDEHDNKYVRMANLATVGSHAVNGVAELHSQLLKTTVLHDFFELSPQKFVSITNGVTPRRWVALANPDLAQLITDRIGEAWLIDGEELRKVEPLAEDPAFRQQWHRIKQTRKVELAGVIQRCTGIVVDPTSLFDVQVKRIHEYKRQLLNLLHVMTLYNRIRKDPGIDIIPRTVIFGGKAAPGYQMARLIIKLINCVGDIVNRDPVMAKRLKVVFFPNFNVTNAQLIYPAADLSEQISTAGTEASGTGNMKFALNGALTIGTFDGANIEIREQVGADNFFLFGLTVDRILQLRAGIYDPRRYYEEDSELREVVDQLSSGAFSGGDKELFKTIVHSLLNRDEYLLFADFRSYLERQADVDKAYRDREHWNRMSILNVARIGKFSSDRSVREYCAKIWDVTPARILRRCGTARRAAGT